MVSRNEKLHLHFQKNFQMEEKGTKVGFSLVKNQGRQGDSNVRMNSNRFGIN